MSWIIQDSRTVLPLCQVLHVRRDTDVSSFFLHAMESWRSQS